MASIKLFKKEVSAIANELALACIFSKSEITEEDASKINEILADIYHLENDYRKKVYDRDSIKDKKALRQYFNKLYDEVGEKAQTIIEKIRALN